MLAGFCAAWRHFRIEAVGSRDVLVTSNAQDVVAVADGLDPFSNSIAASGALDGLLDCLLDKALDGFSAALLAA